MDSENGGGRKTSTNSLDLQVEAFPKSGSSQFAQSITRYLNNRFTLEYLIAVLSRTSFLGDFPWHTLLLDTSRFSKFYYVEKKNFAF